MMDRKYYTMRRDTDRFFEKLYLPNTASKSGREGAWNIHPAERYVVLEPAPRRNFHVRIKKGFDYD